MVVWRLKTLLIIDYRFFGVVYWFSKELESKRFFVQLKGVLLSHQVKKKKSFLDSNRNLYFSECWSGLFLFP